MGELVNRYGRNKNQKNTPKRLLYEVQFVFDASAIGIWLKFMIFHTYISNKLENIQTRNPSLKILPYVSFPTCTTRVVTSKLLHRLQGGPLPLKSGAITPISIYK